MNSDSRVVKGLNIATLIITILGIVGALIIIFTAALGGAAVSDPSVARSLNADVNLYTNGAEEIDPSVVAIFLAAFGGVVGGLVLIAKIVALIASILALRNADKPEKLGAAFVWAIIAAIISFLFGSIISCVLFVVSAVYINRVKRGPVAPAYVPAGYPGSYADPGVPGNQGSSAYSNNQMPPTPPTPPVQ